MVFVIKATLRETTRRLTFDTTKFPLYSDIQNKVSIFLMASPSQKKEDEEEDATLTPATLAPDCVRPAFRHSTVLGQRPLLSG